MISNSINQATVTISKEALSKLPAAHITGSVELIDRPEDVAEAVSDLRNAEIIGFDTETRPSFKKGLLHTVSLMQLATPAKCYLFRLNKIGFVKELIDILEDPDLLKIGLSIHDDFHSLRRLAPVDPKGFIDLQQYVKQFKISDNSLSRIYGILFGERISKGQRLTNWEAETLTPAQQGYAALDAVACIRIYRHLQSGAFYPYTSPYLTFPDPLPPIPNS
ncbi:MAG: 3'-5' exonuclease domain-containing protein 2 [Bacteroides sp.]|nr:3'-5' exonuclease domain-containing protein 2 [Bacteroides sp.]